MSNRVTVKEAARLIGTSEQTVRYGILNGTLNIGSYVKIPGTKRTTYLISRALLNKYLGIKEEQNN